MKKEYSKRFEDAPWMLPEMPYANLFGCGGIGSYCAFFLSRLNMPLTILDMDTVEEVNMAGQFYTVDSIGLTKALALYSCCAKFGGGSIKAISAKVEESLFEKSMQGIDFDIPIWISAFDNMEARELLFRKWKEMAKEQITAGKPDLLGTATSDVTIYPIFIDGRLTAETLQVFAIIKETDYKRFEENLFKDDEVEDLPCSFKATSHCAGMIGAVITGLLTNHITNCVEKKNIREIPFYTEMSLPLMMLNIAR